jgi:hypothetical protein
MQTKSDIALVAPTGKSEQLPLVGVPTPYRKREHLTETEIGKLIEAAKGNRYGRRDATRSYRRPGSKLLARLIGGSCCSYLPRDGLSGFWVLLTSSL